VAVDRSVSPNRLYAADTSNNRVLGWQNVAAFTNGAPADLVIGQNDFLSTGCNQNRTDAGGNSLPAPNTLCAPGGVAVDVAGDLWVADSGNFRVLLYNVPFSSGMSSGQSASAVLGQQGSFISRVNNNGGVSATSMSSPAGLAVDAGGALYVADPNNNRVLKFNHPGAAQTAADVVFGQGGSFTRSTCNYRRGCTGGVCASADSLCGPTAVAVDAINVYIADTVNNRVLQFPVPVPQIPLAALVVGQTNLSGANCVTLCRPQGVALDASGNLYAADAFNDDIKGYKAPLTNNPPAGLVIGSALCGQEEALGHLVRSVGAGLRFQ
jgi:sugar lactone lactonase YvrE